MKGLLLRLSAVDSGAETAVRVIAYFDELIARRATLPELLRATAFLAESVAGFAVPTAPCSGTGRPANPVAPPGTGRVWLERAGEPGPLDDLVLDPVEPPPAAPHLADPALVELVLGEQAADRALTLLGLDTAPPLRVVAVASGTGRDACAGAANRSARG
ncbi:hypothetical protein [Amycolatopsis rubida]|uniref:Uncharacterized protein n=1 Tax=Amycolatopsis rubida TaxID=112413 RepID=A0A1I6A2C8_9PSEU|nr:hypothetical protein [Amycolatopsis rubida]SFQ62753.1 hypothetical protein SAMN05421854_11733 [Amycolatopsis rubida]